MALREHASVNKKGIFDEALSTFFRNVDSKAKSTSHFESVDVPVGKGNEKIYNLKARAVLIDSEEGKIFLILLIYCLFFFKIKTHLNK